MSQSPIEQLLGAVDKFDVGAVTRLLAPDARMLTVDGARATGEEAVLELLTRFFANLRSSQHRITDQWHQDNVWIAEVEATYELQDWLRIAELPRVVIIREGPGGITDLRIYGAHERPLTEHRTGDEGMWIGERWIPPL